MKSIQLFYKMTLYHKAVTSGSPRFDLPIAGVAAGTLTYNLTAGESIDLSKVMDAAKSRYDGPVPIENLVFIYDIVSPLVILEGD